MHIYEIYYLVNNKEYHTPYEAETFEDALLDAKYQLEDCKGYTVLEEKTREEKENQY